MANILVVDDDTNILEVIRTRLEANDYYVEIQEDPLEALNCVREKEFDVIVSDIRMPHIDGMEFLRRVQRLRWDVPVIMLTAYGTIQSAVETMKHGAFHIAKEEGINIIASGHYATERHGLLSLMKVLSKKFPIKTVMIESPTGL